ncbi:MAG: 1-acyl-sn-glycerol-3-phosphate acyltransferase [Planctomycetes bacterium]|nr:1-acyl-sn-glycerol-3-phosphate acyltransferase [Planctomycetota bacterium]
MTFSDAIYDASYLLNSGIMTFGFSLRMEGQHNMPASGPVLVLANHQSFLDPVIVGLAAGRRMCYLARKTLFRNRLFAGLIRAFRAVPIDQDGVGKEGIRTVLDLLGAGKGVVVFPEGERTPTGELLPMRAGVHLLLRRTACPIVPMGIAGAYDAWPRWRPYPVPAPLFWPARPGAIAVSVAPPIDSRQLLALPREQFLDELFNIIKKSCTRAEQLRRRQGRQRLG